MYDLTQGQAPRALISIIVATLNCESRLSRCLRSIADQTYHHHEVIVMDGGSVDGTVDILRAAGNVVTYWESAADKGIYDAWNKALKHIHGEWICFLGADDYFWSPASLMSVVRAIRERPPRARIIYSRLALVNASGVVLETLGSPWTRRGPASLRRTPLPFPAVFHHASIFEEHGGFDVSFRVAGDYDFLVRTLRSSDVHFIPDILVAMEIGGVSGRIVSKPLVLQEMARVWQKHGISPMPPIWWWVYGRAKLQVALRGALGEHRASKLFDLYRLVTGRPPLWTRR